MNRGRPLALFALALLLILGFQFRQLLAPGHSLYLSLVDDPGAWWSWYPWDVFSAGCFRGFEFPLWNPLSGTGFPHLANFASSPFSPLKWPFYLFPHYRLLDAMVFARVFFLGLFSFLFLSRLFSTASAPASTRESAAAAGALGIALSGYVMEYVNIFNLATEMWLPAGLYLLHGQIHDRPTLRRFLLLGLVSALALSGGNPEAAFYYILFLSLYALVTTWGTANLSRALRSVLAPLVLAGLLITAQGVPLVEYLGQGWHIHTGRLDALVRFDPRNFWSLLLPWLVGPNRATSLQLFMLPYLGVSTLGLAAVAFFHFDRQNRPLLFFLLYPLFFLGVIYNLPGFSWIGEIPPFRQSGNFKFAMPGITLSLAGASGFGLLKLLSGQTDRRRTALALALMTALVFGGIAFAWNDPALPPVRSSGWLGPLLLLVVLATLLAAFRKKPSPLLGPALCALVALDLLLLYPGLRTQGEVDPAGIAAQNPVAPAYLEPLLRDPGRYRFLGQGQAVHHSLNLLYRVNDLRAFEALYPRDYVQAFALIEGFPMTSAVDAFFRHGWSFDVKPENLNHPLLNLLGVKYFLTSEPIAAPGWQLLGQGKILTYQNPKVFPRAFLWAGDALKLDAHEFLPPPPAKILNYQNQRVILEANTPAPAWLVLTDTYFPGWQAKVNGKEAKIEKAADLVRAVKVPAGNSQVEMIYRPWGFRLGLWASLVSGFFCMGAAFLGWKRLEDSPGS